MAGSAGSAPSSRLTVDLLQILQQHPPGHPVHHQVVDRQQQALLAGRAVHQHRAQQRPLFEVEAALGLGEQLGAFVEGLHRNVPEQFLFVQRTMLRQPLAVDLAERQAQGIMLFDQALQGLAQQTEVNGLPRLQQQRLVPVFAARRRQVEEPVLDRRQRAVALHRPLLGLAGLAVPGHRGEALHGLVLEQVAGAEVDAELAGAADHLDRQDRIAAQFEEVVAETYPLDVQHLAPDPGQLLLQHAARGLVEPAG